MKILAMTDFVNNPQVEHLNQNIASLNYIIQHVSSDQGGWMPVKKSVSSEKNPFLKKYQIKSNVINSLPYVWGVNIPFSVWKMINRDNIDLIHSHYIFFFSKSAYFNKIINNLPWVISIRGFTNDFGNFGLNIITSLYYRTLLTKMVNSSDFLIVQSKDTLKRMQQAKIPIPSRYAIITNGVDTTKFIPKKWDFKKEKLIIGFVGRIIPHKGVWELLFAVRRLLESGLDIFLDFYGSGSLEEKVKEYVNSVPILKKNIRFRGFHTDLIRVYHSIDIFVLPSETEGSPNSMMEAMACGIPVIASNVGAIPDILNKYPFIINPRSVDDIENSIRQLVEQKESLEEIGEELRTLIVRNYNWPIIAQKTRIVYDSLV